MIRLGLFGVVVLYIGLCGILLTACDVPEYYRYPCMDPKNWERADCKRPVCAVTQECPDQLLKPEDMKGDQR